MSDKITAMLESLESDRAALQEMSERLRNQGEELRSALEDGMWERGIRRFWRHSSSPLLDGIQEALRNASQEAEGCAVRLRAAVEMTEEVGRSQPHLRAVR